MDHTVADSSRSLSAFAGYANSAAVSAVMGHAVDKASKSHCTVRDYSNRLLDSVTLCHAVGILG